MQTVSFLLFWICSYVIFWAMVGYPFTLKLINLVFKPKSLVKDFSHHPTVTVMVVAHNEEKVIRNKLDNIIQLVYPRSKIYFLISSDNSTDKTNDIVKNFIFENPEHKIELFVVKERKGKTNAQNEAQKKVITDFMVMTDANSMLDKNAVKELIAAFSSNDIAYVTGKLSIINEKSCDISRAEKNYWDSDLSVREIEGRLQTITAGNGALYACRTDDYYDFDPIECHDSSMPIYFALNRKRAIANHDAMAYEKAGEVIEDEMSRKIRMNRMIIKHILPDFRILNVFKYKWFSFFYFGHRTCRYLLWISHFMLLLTSVILALKSWLFFVVFIFQLVFYALALLRSRIKTKNKYLTMIFYYTMTIIAQWIGVYNIISGKSKPFWEKAESTR